MTVLITGAGLVGAQIAKLEQAEGRRPVLYDVAPRLGAIAEYVDLDQCDVVRGDLLSPLDLVGAITKHGATRVIHTAAFPNLTAGANEAPLAAIQVNLLGTAYVLEAARHLGLERVVICSSSALYANMAGGDDNGADGHEERYPRPTTVYATTKQAGEDLAYNYANTFGVDVLAVRFASVFGPWAAGGGGIATTAMEGWLRGALAGSPVRVMPSRLEWVYSIDAARGAHLACWTDHAKNRVFNVGMGVTYDGTELAAALAAVVPGADVAPAAPVEGALTVEMTPMSLERSGAQLGYTPAFPMEEALADYRDWITRQG